MTAVTEVIDISHLLTKYRHFHRIASASKHFPLVLHSRNTDTLSSFIAADLTVDKKRRMGFVACSCPPLAGPANRHAGRSPVRQCGGAVPPTPLPPGPL